MFDKGNDKNYFHIQSHQENHQKHEKRPDFAWEKSETLLDEKVQQPSI